MPQPALAAQGLRTILSNPDCYQRLATQAPSLGNAACHTPVPQHFLAGCCLEAPAATLSPSSFWGQLPSRFKLQIHCRPTFTNLVTDPKLSPWRAVRHWSPQGTSHLEPAWEATGEAPQRILESRLLLQQFENPQWLMREGRCSSAFPAVLPRHRVLRSQPQPSAALPRGLAPPGGVAEV